MAPPMTAVGMPKTTAVMSGGKPGPSVARSFTRDWTISPTTAPTAKPATAPIRNLRHTPVSVESDKFLRSNSNGRSCVARVCARGASRRRGSGSDVKPARYVAVVWPRIGDASRARSALRRSSRIPSRESLPNALVQLQRSLVCAATYQMSAFIHSYCLHPSCSPRVIADASTRWVSPLHRVRAA